MISNWIFKKAIVDGDKYEIHKLNIWEHEWKRTGESIKVNDPLYGQNYSLNVYEIVKDGLKVKFAAGEFSNGVWGIYEEN